MPNMVQIIKQAAVEAVEAGKPADIIFGTVVKDKPLQIKIDQKLILQGKSLTLTRSVTDYDVEMTVAHSTEPAGARSHSHKVTITKDSGTTDQDSAPNHSHSYKGTKTFTVRNALKTGEKAALLRMAGGQRYLVLDRVVM